ncbi:hypothetical protein DOY81_008576, partial [Sarcophaga bullata]
MLLEMFRFIVERKCRYLTTMLTYRCQTVLPDSNEIRNQNEGITFELISENSDFSPNRQHS